MIKVEIEVCGEDYETTIEILEKLTKWIRKDGYNPNGYTIGMYVGNAVCVMSEKEEK